MRPLVETLHLRGIFFILTATMRWMLSPPTARVSAFATGRITFWGGESFTLKKVLGSGLSGSPCFVDDISTTTCRAVTSSAVSSFADTPLASDGAHLLKGLDIYSVPADGDNHPLAVYGIESEKPSNVDATGNQSLPILLLHGRTWSSVPVFHLHLQDGGFGDPNGSGEQSRSLMEALLAMGLQPYAMDFRGFGGTPHDKSGYVEPNRCVEDAETVLQWIADRHDLPSDAPALLGWSQGALVAQMVAQKTQPFLSKLVLYGSIYDPLVRYPRDPLYASKPNRTKTSNTFDDAIEDFTLEGTIPPEPARKFAEAALVADPIKAPWRHLYQFNNCDPARVRVPTLVLAGDQDPYAPLHVQQELFTNLGRGCDRTWSILTNCDHAVHLLEGRHRMTNIVASFIQNGKRSEQTH